MLDNKRAQVADNNFCEVVLENNFCLHVKGPIKEVLSFIRIQRIVLTDIKCSIVLSSM